MLGLVKVLFGEPTVNSLRGVIIPQCSWPLFAGLAVDAHVTGVANIGGAQLRQGF